MERLLADDLGVLGAATLTLPWLAAFEVGHAATHGRGFAFAWTVLLAYLGFVGVWGFRLRRVTRYRRRTSGVRRERRNDPCPGGVQGSEA